MEMFLFLKINVLSSFLWLYLTVCAKHIYHSYKFIQKAFQTQNRKQFIEWMKQISQCMESTYGNDNLKI